jgi:hypothetical protein
MDDFDLIICLGSLVELWASGERLRADEWSLGKDDRLKKILSELSRHDTSRIKVLFS